MLWIQYGSSMNALAVAALFLSATTLVFYAPTAQACAAIVVADHVDPVYEVKKEWVHNPYWCYHVITPIDCNITPVVEYGSPTIHNGYREGIYLYDCHETAGTHTSTTARTENDLGPPACHYVPYVAAGGKQVPGTDQTHCTLQHVNGSHTQPIHSPDVFPASGAFRVFRSDGYDRYQYVDPTLVSTCWGPGVPPLTVAPTPQTETSVSHPTCYY